MTSKQSLDSIIKRIKLIILDVDGVLTDGRIYYNSDGNEMKIFNVSDGSGMVYAHRVGMKTVIVSGNYSPAVTKRAEATRADALYQNVHTKIDVLDDILNKFSVKPEEVCFVGDDLIDIPVMKKIGFPVAVKNAVPEVKRIASFITKNTGGNGAVRETIELILKRQGKWQDVLKRYYS